MSGIQLPQHLVPILSSLFESCSERYAKKLRSRLLSTNHTEELADQVAEKAKFNFQQGFIMAIKQTRKCINYRIDEVAKQNNFTASQVNQLHWACNVAYDGPMPDEIHSSKIVVSAAHAETLFRVLTKAIDVIGPNNPRYDEFLNAINELKNRQK